MSGEEVSKKAIINQKSSSSWNKCRGIMGMDETVLSKMLMLQSEQKKISIHFSIPALQLLSVLFYPTFWFFLI